MIINYAEVKWLSERAILAPTHKMLHKLKYGFQRLVDTSEMTSPLIQTAVDQNRAVQYPVEFLNLVKLTGMLLHNLTPKLDAPVISLRNLDSPRTPVYLLNLA